MSLVKAGQGTESQCPIPVGLALAPRALSRFQVKGLRVLGSVHVSPWACVRGCVNATLFSHRFDTPSVLKPTFLGPTRPSKAQIAIFDNI